jgi:uroporphyrinogen decarboxylase
MNHRERLLASLNHEEPDRVPLDIGASLITGINRRAYLRLLEKVGLPPEDPPFFDIVQQLATPSESFLRRFDIDVRNVSPSSNGSWSLSIEKEGEYLTFVDQWGIKWRMPVEGGFYYDMVEHPLKNEDFSMEEARSFPLPDIDNPSRYATIRADAQRVRDQGYGVVMSSVGAGVLELGGWLRGYENFYSDLLLNEDVARAYLDRVLEVKLRYWDRVLGAAGDLIDVVQEADDLGSQNSMLISPDTYRRIVKPIHARLFAFIHARTKAKIFLHSCGSFIEVVPDLIEVGLDILNPVQYKAQGMDARVLKREFGKDLVFWGGGVDTQRILPTGTPQEVRDDVARQMDILAPGGGFVFNTVHNIQADVPPENLVAMFEAFEANSRY